MHSIICAYLLLESKAKPVLLQDLDGLILFSRKRARDEKGSVRKAGMQLLESLLVMSVRGMGGAAVQTPPQGDLEAIEAATFDPLVVSLYLLPILVLASLL